MTQPFPELEPLLECARSLIPNSVVVLFGSRARGDHAEWSDYDILVLADELPDTVDPLYRSIRDLRVDMHCLSTKEYRTILNQWLEGSSNENVVAAGKEIVCRTTAEVGMFAAALEGICLSGAEQFQPFLQLRDQWVAEERISDPALRRLVSVDDGLTDIQRNLLAAVPIDNKFVKSARVVGKAMSPGLAGSSFLYRLMVRMLQPWSSRYPLICGQGNFCSPSGQPFAAMRYTECKASAWMQFGRESAEFVSAEKLNELARAIEGLAETSEVSPAMVRKTVANTIGNVSGEYVELAFPNLLANGSLRLPAVDSAIPSYWLPGIVDSLNLVLQNPKSSDDALLDVLGVPDFACGGVLSDSDEVREVLKLGHGNIRLTPQIEMGQATGRQEQAIVITSLPFSVTGWELEEEMSKERNEKRLPGVKKVVNQTSLDRGIRYELPLTKKADAVELLARLATFMSVEIPIDIRVNVDGHAEQMNQAALVRHESERQLRLHGNSKGKVVSELTKLRAMDDAPRRTKLA